MWGKSAFAASVITLLACSAVVQAQILLQPRDTLPSQSNSTQDDILPRDNWASLPSANTSDTYSNSGASVEHTIEARNPRPGLPKFKVPLRKKASQYTATIFVDRFLSSPPFDVVFATTAFDQMWLVDVNIKQEPNQGIFEHKGRAIDSNSWKRAKEIKVKIFGGEGQGRIFRTKIAIGRVSLGEIRVGLLDKVTGFGSEIGDGVLPFARLPMDASRTAGSRASAWDALIGTRAGDERMAAFALRPDAGEVHIGMIDDQAHVGPIEYWACAKSSPFWAIDDATIHIGPRGLSRKRIIFDTTSQFIRGPKADVEQLYSWIWGLSKTFHADLGLYSISCNPPDSIRIGIYLHSHWRIELLNPEYFIRRIVTHPDLCFGLLAPHTANTVSVEGRNAKPNPMPEPSDWIIGYPLMVGYYTVLHWGELQIGIARLKTPELYPFSSQTRVVD